jgi:hypothetical protein
MSPFFKDKYPAVRYLMTSVSVSKYCFRERGKPVESLRLLTAGRLYIVADIEADTYTAFTSLDEALEYVREEYGRELKLAECENL